jgi:ankyrin repeat protein
MSPGPKARRGLGGLRNVLEMADLLLRAGADVKAANEYGATALCAAANASPYDREAATAGADANAPLSGETPPAEGGAPGLSPRCACCWL